MRYKAYGEANHHTTLTDRDVNCILEIRSLGYTMRDIAEFYSVSTSTVHRILRGHTWGHVKRVPICEGCDMPETNCCCG